MRGKVGVYGIAQTMAAAASILAWDIRRIKFHQAAGCRAFKANHKINCDELLEWDKSHKFEPDDSGIDWDTELKKVKTKREQVKLDRDNREVVEWSTLRSYFQLQCSIVRGALAKMVQECPPDFEGRNAREIKLKLDKRVEEMEDDLRNQLEKLNEN